MFVQGAKKYLHLFLQGDKKFKKFADDIAKVFIVKT